MPRTTSDRCVRLNVSIPSSLFEAMMREGWKPSQIMRFGIQQALAGQWEGTIDEIENHPNNDLEG